MKYVLVALGIALLVGLTGGLAYTAVRGNPTMRVFGDSLPVSVRNDSATYHRSTPRSRSGVYYYGSGSRRHYGGGYSSGK